MTDDSAQSAYGLTITGLPRLPELQPGPCRDTTTEVRIVVDPETRPWPKPHALDADRGARALADGRMLALDRRLGRATFFGPSLAPDLLAHPYLAPVATAFNRWAGRETFHAGAFVAHGRAWVVLGPRTAGKSTMMAALAASGYPVLSDDIVVSDGTVVHPGPRCIDLREVPPINGLDLGVRLARDQTRHRVLLTDRPGPVPLGGWLFLEWSDTLALTPRGPGALIADLAVRRSWRNLPSDPTRLLALSTLPAWTVGRPRRWDALADTLELVESALARTEAPAPLSTGANGGSR